MKTLKIVVTYLMWLLICILLGMIAVMVEIGWEFPWSSSNTFFTTFVRLIILAIGGIIGLVSFLVFLLIDKFYLQRKKQLVKQKTSTRLVVILLITVTIKYIHYILEFQLDWI